MQKKYSLNLGNLLDRLSIVQLKDVRIPEHKAAYGQEIDDLVHDINIELGQNRQFITAEWLRDIIILAQFNAHIFYNEGDVRDKIKEMTDGKELTTDQYIDIAKRLILTHSINGIRSTASNRLNSVVGGRLDYKVDCLAADAAHWKPSGY